MNKNFIRINSRLKNYDYTRCGYYFITICTKDKKHYFGEIINNEIIYNDIGKKAYASIKDIENIYKTITIDNFIIMPNHIHVIIIIDKETEITIPRVVKQYKEYITKQTGKKVWQKSYYDHIIRNESDYLRIYQYINENVLKWSLDKYYSE